MKTVSLGLLTLFALALTLATARAATVTVTTAKDSGPGSLRQAILDANATPGRDTIEFLIKEPVPVTLAPATALPSITEGLLLDGWSQPDATTNTSRRGFNAVLGIQLDGSGIASPTSGLYLDADNCEIRGLDIRRFPGAAIYANSGEGHLFRGNLLVRNNGDGITLRRSVRNSVGDGTAAGRNVIIGNAGHGLHLYGGRNEQNVILGNLIGVEPDGTGGSGNGGDGIRITDAPSNQIGDPRAEVGNVISGNTGCGILITNLGATENLVVANLIGTDASGALPLPNGASGVQISSSRNQIGGSADDGQGNLIAFNGGDGIRVLAGTNVALRSNQIFSNDGLGIDLGGDGVTANDGGDADAGPNQLQNYPVLLSVRRLYPQVLVQGRLNSRPHTAHTVDLFSGDTADPSGHGEGALYRGSLTVTTDGAGEALFSHVLSLNPPYGVITATATDPGGNTSEFSPARAVGEGPDLWISLSPDAEYAGIGSNLLVRVEIGNNGPTDAAGVVVSNQVPAGFSVVSMTVTQGTWSVASGVAVWNVGNLGEEESLTAELLLRADAPNYSSLISTISSWTFDPFPYNSDHYWLSAGYSDLAVMLDVSANPVVAGQALSFHATITNRGPQTAQGVGAAVWLMPHQFHLQSVTVPFGTWEWDSDGFVQWNVGALAASTGGTMIVRGFAQDVGVVDANGEIWSEGVEPEYEDNSASAGTTVVEGPGVLNLEANTITVPESIGTVDLIVMRAGGTAGTVAVQYSTTPGTALAGVDYTPVSGTLTFTNGELAKTVHLDIVDDGASEWNESFIFRLTNPTGGVVLGGASVMTIVIGDNDIPTPGTVTAASVTPGPDPVTGDGQSSGPRLSADGRRVAFHSAAQNLVTNTAVAAFQVFVRDLAGGQTLLASVNFSGTAGGDQSSYAAAVSADGRRVAYDSQASDLVPGDTNDNMDAFVRDLGEPTNRLAGVRNGGSLPGDMGSYAGGITPDGRYMLLHSTSGDLVPGDQNESMDVFRRDLAAGTTMLVSRSRLGSWSADGWSSDAACSSNGQFIAFESDAPDIAPRDGDRNTDIFLFNAAASTNALVSINAAHTAAAGGHSPAISPDGRYVAFMTSSTNVVAGGIRTDDLQNDLVLYDRLTGSNRFVCSMSRMNQPAAFSADSRFLAFSTKDGRLTAMDTNGVEDVFRLELASGALALVSVNCAGTGGANGRSQRPAISADGQYVAFLSQATDLAPGTYTPEVNNVFRRDLLAGSTVLASRRADGLGGCDYNCQDVAISADGGTIAYASLASDLVANDVNWHYDIFVWSDSAGPRLAIAHNSLLSTINLSWPAPAEGWILERTNRLSNPSADWPPVPPPYQTNAGVISVTITNAPGSPSQFFRLRKR